MSRFEKGRSGNPKGRPRKQPAAAQSAFDIILDRHVTVNQGGTARELTIEEALQFKTYQEAIAGNKPARRDVLKMIAKREQWLTKSRPPQNSMQVLHSHDSRTADDAMILLGIASEAPPWGDNDPYRRLQLEPWAVEAAIARLRPKRLKRDDLDNCRRCTRDPHSINWPEVED